LTLNDGIIIIRAALVFRSY